jgi:hypothetical protein
MPFHNATSAFIPQLQLGNDCRTMASATISTSRDGPFLVFSLISTFLQRRDGGRPYHREWIIANILANILRCPVELSKAGSHAAGTTPPAIPAPSPLEWEFGRWERLFDWAETREFAKSWLGLSKSALKPGRLALRAG